VNLHGHYSRGRARFFLTLAFLFVPALACGQAEPSFTEEVEAQVFALVNDVRRKQGLQPVEREARLDATARYFVDYMAASGRLDHRADGRTPAARVKQRGYDYCVISENIEYEYDSRGFTAERLARSFIDGWLQSPMHRENILDANVTQTGLAVARNAKNEYYAVQLFGRPPVTTSAQSSGEKAKGGKAPKRAVRC
jgi:uncharacterized protein YkwD